MYIELQHLNLATGLLPQQEAGLHILPDPRVRSIKQLPWENMNEQYEYP
jgi:hypothetical protein